MPVLRRCTETASRIGHSENANGFFLIGKKAPTRKKAALSRPRQWHAAPHPASFVRQLIKPKALHCSQLQQWSGWLGPDSDPLGKAP